MVKLTEDKLKSIISEAIQYVLETSRIQPWQGNPKQVDLNWGDVRKSDEEWNKENPDTPVNTPERYKELSRGSIEKAKVDKLQNQLSDEIRKRAIEKTGSEYVSPEEIGDMPDAVRKALGEAGLMLGFSGKSFAYGNKKLPPSTMIVNITSAFACPSKDCPYAKSVCYAQKGAKLYKNTELRDMRNQHSYKYLTIKELLTLLEAYIEMAPAKIHDIRISEAGDFETQEQVDLCDKLAGHLKAKYGIKTTVYTHATSLDFSGCRYMIINASSYAVKCADRFYLVRGKNFMEGLKDTSDGIKQRVNSFDKTENYFKCHCDCHVCRFCYNTPEENGEDPSNPTRVYVEKH